MSATAYIKKQTSDGTWHEVSATAHYIEYCQRNKEGQPTRFWEGMAHSQLAKCAEALALRKSFPADLSGLYTADEMRQAAVIEPVQDPDPIPTKKIEPIVETITMEQAVELSDLLAQCDPAYQSQLISTLSKPPFGVHSIEALPCMLYERVRSAILKKWAEAQDKLQENAS